MPVRSVAAALAALLAAGAAEAHWDAGSCPTGLCSTPWAREEPDVVRWAGQTDLCLHAAAGGESVVARGCAETGPLLAADGRGRLRTAGRCLTVAEASEDNSSDAVFALSYEPCDEDHAGQDFELPESRYGPIRATAAGDACLAVRPGKAAVALAPCEAGAVSQAFLLPRAAGSSAFVGVNLGGWLILEGWMWPGRMSTQGLDDEFSFIKHHGGPGSAEARSLMEEHWDTFLRPEHLDTLRRFGATHVRIPLGYWLLGAVYDDADGYVAGGEAYLRRALGWLKARGMHAVLDLHAMPGGQATDEQFTGRTAKVANFFMKKSDNDRGRSAVEALAKLVLAYEESADTFGVVVGVQLLNEPSWRHLHGTFGFYEGVLPMVREHLPASRFLVMLGFMDSPHTASAEWLAAAREKAPEVYDGVVYDLHLYHLYGDNSAPWSEDQDYCKTCCRDAHILDPLTSRGIPTVVGEYSLATGFNGWADRGFAQTNLENQLSLWNTTRHVVGSFAWNFRILVDPYYPQNYMEWSLVDMIGEGLVASNFVYKASLTSLCPAMGGNLQARCPHYRGAKVLYNTKCEWRTPKLRGVVAIAR